MKKARMIMASIAVLAVAGGMLAFKTATSHQTLYTTDTPDTQAFNQVTDAIFTTNTSIPQVYWTDTEGANAPSGNFDRVQQVIE